MTRAVIWCAVSSEMQSAPDKISLKQQEAEARTFAQGNGWEIVETLVVPGHSRRYVDFRRLADDAAKQGMDAFHRLQSHWDAQDFEVLIVWDGDRFARTQALHAYVVERTIDSGARIYSLQDGWIDSTNYRMFIAMSGYRAASHIDRLVDARDKAMTARAKRGLPVSSRIPLCHHLVRDPETGKTIGLVVNEDRRALWNDLAELILEGIAWSDIEHELYKRYGHVNDTGDRFYRRFMYKLITKPVFWGHMARHHASKTCKNGFKVGHWVYDETVPAPEGAMIFRNTHDPVYTGEQAERIKAELRRRSETVRGRATSRYTYRFSGLGVCAECGSFWAMIVRGNHRAVCCSAMHGQRSTGWDCSNTRYCNEKKLVARMTGYLREMLRRGSTEVFDPPNTGNVNVQERLEILDREIATLETQARRLNREKAEAGEAIREFYDEELVRTRKHINNMKVTRSRLQNRATPSNEMTPIQVITLDELAALSIEAFWQQESRYINQVLHRLMGKKRFLLLDGEIIGVAEVARPR